MTDLESLKHTRWECKYHIVFIPKGRKKRIYGQLRKELGSVFKELVQHREGKVEEGHLMTDHVHMLVAVPPTIAVARLAQYLKGTSSRKLQADGVRRPASAVLGATHVGTRILLLDGRDSDRRDHQEIHRESDVGR